ncbi:hypothetical protein [Actinomyces trachealis]|uniref:variant leucine-rich repeat-containing protein n=1 Tax=Actinomyces trachealis TaxID=2763540 RepID=UPI001892C5AF|nr:hypothetical protein [Actinomyces trachealis]
MSQAQDDLVARAQDPRTPLTTLHSLAQNYPGLRPAIALNPSTYPALLEWLGALGDPAVDAALNARSATSADGSKRTVMLPPVIIPSRQTKQEADAQPAASPSDTAASEPDGTTVLPAEAAAAAVATEVGSPAQAVTATSSTEEAPDTDTMVATVGPELTTTPIIPGTLTFPNAEVEPEPTVTGLDSLRQSVVEEPDPQALDDSKLPWIALASAAVVLVAVLLVVFTGNGDSEPTAATTPTATATTQAAVPTLAPTPSPTLAPSTTATPTPTATPSASPTPSESPSATSSAEPTNQVVAPAPADAIALTSFTDPSGNISCVLSGEQASCTIKDRNFASESCEAEVAYSATVTAGKAPFGMCAGSFEANGSPLGAGQSAVQGDYVCTSANGAMECWSQSTGQGFSLTSEAAEAINLSGN